MKSKARNKVTKQLINQKREIKCCNKLNEKEEKGYK